MTKVADSSSKPTEENELKAKQERCNDGPQVSMQAEEDDYPKDLQEEINEIVEAFYSMVGEEDMRKYQTYAEEVMGLKLAEQALSVTDQAPDFALIDQDDETCRLSDVLKKGPVVVIFYRGKWCPMCNVTLMHYAQALKDIQAKGATLLAISPMMPDGTQFTASKFSLQFPVLSDVGNVVTNKFRLTYQVSAEHRDLLLGWGEDIPHHNGDDSWTIPLPATYVINQQGKIVYSFVDDDPGACRADVSEVLAAIPPPANTDSDDESETNRKKHKAPNAPRSPTRMGTRRKMRRVGTFMVYPLKKAFGARKQAPQDFLRNFFPN